MTDRQKDVATESETRALRTEIRVWQVVGWVVAFLPITALLILRRDMYFVGYTGLRVGSGVVVSLVIALLLVLGKLKLPGRVVTLWGLVAILWLIVPLLQDMVLLLAVLAIGVTVDEVICRGRVKYLRQRLERAERREDISAAIAAAASAAASAASGPADEETKMNGEAGGEDTDGA